MAADRDVVLRPEGGARLVRGAAGAVTATSVALLSHLIGGGSMPGPLGVLLPLLVAVSLCALLAGVRLPWLRLTASVAVSQLLFHTLFLVGTPGDEAAAGGMGHTHGAVTLSAGGTGAGQVGHLTTGMLLAHAGAALVTVLLLRHAEVLLARLAGTAARIVDRVLRRPVLPSPAGPPTVRPTGAMASVDTWTVHRLLRAAMVLRRGPPGVAAHPALG